MKKLRVLLCFIILISAPPLGAEETSLPFDHSEWDQFLKKFVNEKGEVNYRAAQEDPRLLEAYLGKLKSFSAKAFDSWPREEKMALLINAYNAGVVRSVLSHYPLKTIMEIPGGWEQSVVQIGKTVEKEGGRIGLEAPSPADLDTKDAGFRYSLNRIEDNHLRQSFRDEKIIFSLCRGAKGSPRLRQEAYTGPKVEGQLYLATREFVNDASRNQIVPGKQKIVLSRLFQWFREDFLLNWGDFAQGAKWDRREMAVLSFFAHYLEDAEKIKFLREAKYKVKYEVFDWRLNDWKSEAAAG